MCCSLAMMVLMGKRRRSDGGVVGVDDAVKSEERQRKKRKTQRRSSATAPRQQDTHRDRRPRHARQQHPQRQHQHQPRGAKNANSAANSDSRTNSTTTRRRSRDDQEIGEPSLNHPVLKHYFPSILTLRQFLIRHLSSYADGRQDAKAVLNARRFARKVELYGCSRGRQGPASASKLAATAIASTTDDQTKTPTVTQTAPPSWSAQDDALAALLDSVIVAGPKCLASDHDGSNSASAHPSYYCPSSGTAYNSPFPSPSSNNTRAKLSEVRALMDDLHPVFLVTPISPPILA